MLDLGECPRTHPLAPRYGINCHEGVRWRVRWRDRPPKRAYRNGCCAVHVLRLCLHPYVLPRLPTRRSMVGPSERDGRTLHEVLGNERWRCLDQSSRLGTLGAARFLRKCQRREGKAVVRPPWGRLGRIMEEVKLDNVRKDLVVLSFETNNSLQLRHVSVDEDPGRGSSCNPGLDDSFATT